MRWMPWVALALSLLAMAAVIVELWFGSLLINEAALQCRKRVDALHAQVSTELQKGRKEIAEARAEIARLRAQAPR